MVTTGAYLSSKMDTAYRKRYRKSREI